MDVCMYMLTGTQRIKKKIEENTHEENIFKNRFKGKRKLKLVHYMLHSHSRQFI